jgi:UPF0755 protein
MSAAGRRRGRGAAWAGLLLFVAIVLVLIAGAAAALSLDWKTPYARPERGGVFVDIAHGTSAAAIARQLESSGVIRSAFSFRALLLRHPSARLEAGEYFFDRPRTPEEVFDALAYGKIFLTSVTVPEGYTMFEIAALLESKGITSRDGFLGAARDPSLIAGLAPGAPSLEGFLFPATYQFPRHQPPRKVAEALVRRFREAWQTFPENERGASGLTPLGLVTLASLVEKETGVAGERPLVARVFTNRLRAGVALDCDPTVIYALILGGKHDGAGKYDGQLRPADLRVDSAYNTYRRRGLPPGPIANPGAASLRAALEPARGDYLYFVATGDGGHVFSRTLKEHNRNVAQYRRRLAQLAREAAGRAGGKSTP